MADTIKISLPNGYEAPTSNEIAKAKKWTLLRNENAARLSSLIEQRLQDAIQELARIGYRYNVKPEDFQFSQNEELREEVAGIMNDIEDDIYDLVQEYSLNETEDKKRRNKILPWLLALHSNNTDSLRGTLHERLRQFLFDTEAQIAAMMMAGHNLTKATGRMLSTMHSVYASPEMLSAFKKKAASVFIQSRGVHEGNVGLSSSGAVNVENFGDMTARMAWSRSQYQQAVDEGKAGYFCFRGSTFPCGMCDDVCSVFHKMEEGMVLPVHGHCCCYAVFVDLTDENRSSKQEQYKKLKKDKNYYDVEFDETTGGLKATHIDHNFDKKGGEYEKNVQNAGYKAGHTVILGAEYGNVIGKRYAEGTWDGKSFEVAGRETATINNILRGLKHCAAKRTTEIAVLDFPNGGFNLDKLNEAIKRYRGLEKLNDGQYLKFKQVICVQNNRIVYDRKF